MTNAPINLNKVRKARDRDTARKKAEANVAYYGRTKAERMLEVTQADKARAMLDSHKLDDAE